MLHPCERIYQIGANGKAYGSTSGTCRITGKKAIGLPFEKWVRDTFTDHGALLPGDIISNEALFCFDESSEIVQLRSGKEKLQRFRTYSHIINKGEWLVLTKADKHRIADIMLYDDPELVCLSDTGQKHLLFKHRTGLWQLEEMQLMPDRNGLAYLYERMMKLLTLGFSQREIITGYYMQYWITKCGIRAWKDIEDEIRQYRNTKLFNLSAWMMYTTKE